MSDNEGNMSDDEGKKQKGTKRKKEKGPKRPMSAYMYFCSAHRPKVKSENPNASFGEVGKLLGAKWQTLKESEKRPFEKQNEEAKKRYEDEKAAGGGGDDDAPRPKKSKTGGGGGGGKKSKGANEPARAKNAFMWFADEERKKLKEEQPNLKFTETGRVIGERWKALNDSEKEPYTKKAADDKVEKEAARKKWEKDYPEEAAEAKKAKEKKKEGKKAKKAAPKKKAAAAAAADESGDDEGSGGDDE